MNRILVTGASGNVGSRVARLLAAEGASVRALVRRRDRAKLPAAVEIVEGSYDDGASLRRALEGVTSAFLLTVGPGIAKQDAAFLETALSTKLERVVKLSIAGAAFEGSTIARWHRAGEKLLEASRFAWTHLRPGGFASNALGWAGSVRASGTVYGALGDAALPVIDPADIAASAARVLTTPGHEGKAYDLTGPASLTPAQQVEQLSQVIGKPLNYVNVPDAAARQGMLDGGMPEPMADAMIDLVQKLRSFGRLEPSGAVRELLGREPRPFRAWAEENAAAFR